MRSLFRISKDITEKNIPVGNVYNKYSARNPLVRRIMAGFERSLDDLVLSASPSNIHEVGCGEGYWVIRWIKAGICSRGSDFSEKVLSLARQNAMQEGIRDSIFFKRSVYELRTQQDSADLIACCEVLEHLEEPNEALNVLTRITTNYIVLSVPREPLWRILNIVRGKYLRSFGNSPGHLQHWSTRSFLHLVSMYFNVLDVRTPFPWTMVLCRPKCMVN